MPFHLVYWSSSDRTEEELAEYPQPFPYDSAYLLENIVYQNDPQVSNRHIVNEHVWKSTYCYCQHTDNIFVSVTGTLLSTVLWTSQEPTLENDAISTHEQAHAVASPIMQIAIKVTMCGQYSKQIACLSPRVPDVSHFRVTSAFNEISKGQLPHRL